MTDKPDLGEAVEESDPVGNFDTRELQQQGRVAIPKEYREHLGLDINDSIMVVCEEDHIKVMEAKVDKLSEL